MGCFIPLAFCLGSLKMRFTIFFSVCSFRLHHLLLLQNLGNSVLLAEFCEFICTYGMLQMFQYCIPLLHQETMLHVKCLLSIDEFKPSPIRPENQDGTPKIVCLFVDVSPFPRKGHSLFGFDFAVRYLVFGWGKPNKILPWHILPRSIFPCPASTQCTRWWKKNTKITWKKLGALGEKILIM